MNSSHNAITARLTQPAPLWIQKYLSYAIGAVFAGAAAVLLWILGGMFANHYSARSWIAVPAQITSAELRESRSGTLSRPTSSSRIAVAYHYTYNGREFSGKRVDFSFGSDNFSDARRSRQMRILDTPAPLVYVNPLRPEESVIDRSLPVEQVNFGVLFLFFPCALGTLMFLGAVAGLADRLGWSAPSRYVGPAFGIVHALPAFYAPLVTPHSLGVFGWCIVAAAALSLLASLRSVWRRIACPDSIDSTDYSPRRSA